MPYVLRILSLPFSSSPLEGEEAEAEAAGVKPSETLSTGSLPSACLMKATQASRVASSSAANKAQRAAQHQEPGSHTF